MNISYNKIGAAAKLLFKKNFGLLVSLNLESLFMVETDFNDNLITKVLCKELANGRFKNIRDLDLSHNLIKNSYQNLTRSLQSNCELLGNLSIASCKFFELKPPVSFALPKSFFDPISQTNTSFIYLKRLDLSSSISGDEQVAQLASSSAFKFLEFLKLKNCEIGNAGFTSLVSSKYLKRVKVLILSKNNINTLIFPSEKQFSKI